MALENSVEVLTRVTADIGEPAMLSVGVAAEPPLRRAADRNDAFHHNVSLLARALLDLRAVREAEIRTLTAMQRYLETIRADECVSGESELLLGEIERQLKAFCAPGNGTHELLCSASTHLEQIRALVDAARRAKSGS